MKIVFCITCRGRLQHIQQTLVQNVTDNLKAKFVLLSYGDRDGLDEHIRDRCFDLIELGHLAYYQFKDAQGFKMAHAKNMAHRLGIIEGADVLVNLDADNLTGPGFTEYIEELFERTARDPQEIFLWTRMIKGVLSKGVSGRIAVTRNAFLISGGYDERFETHSPDDRDFNVRLRRLGYVAQEIDSRHLLAINHNDKVRFKEWPELQNRPTNYNDNYQISPVSRIVNYGSTGCGTVYKNFSDEPFVLGRLPTRIFGIGMHKTATTSLHTAFGILGLKSGHWENAHWAKAVWNEMTGLGHSAALERFYALSDIPFPILFEQLDRAYPGSKFILTLRDELDWLRSVEGHFDRGTNQYWKQWNNDPFTHRAHKMIYGQKNFEPSLFLRKYREHNARVLDYFRSRPCDLLVMNMSSGAGWPELCGFLKMPVPPEPYPSKLKTR